jgi:hypothetical protein
MKIKTMLTVGVLCLTTMILGNAKTTGKSYEIHLSVNAEAGKVQLPAGDYKMKVDGDKAVLTDSEKHEFTVPVKVETAGKKFDQTSVITSDSSGKMQLKSVEIGGSTTKVDFGD